MTKTQPLYDVAIIGGGINGCGIAADAASRGLSVFLCEQGDLGSATSSQSSKLIHGGLRYLEYHEFSLVKKALEERQRLLNIAPHLVHPLPFVLPYLNQERPAWLIRCGLFLYDHLSRKNKLPHTKKLSRQKNPLEFDCLNHDIQHGFLFYDARADDARLTLINALQANVHGAAIHPRTRLMNAQIKNGLWSLTLQDASEKNQTMIEARVVVNATGPWLPSTSRQLGIPLKHSLSLVKGSHLVVKKIHDGPEAYLLQHSDKRVVFVIPYYGNHLIGTTEVLFSDSPEKAQINADEINYLLLLVNRHFKKTIHHKDIIQTWSGVRPLIADVGHKPSGLSRDYVLDFDVHPAPCINVYGGKITTYRVLAQEAVDHLKTIIPNLKNSQTATTPLPGAMLEHQSLQEYCDDAKHHYAWLDEKILNRYLQTYGTRTEMILEGCSNPKDLGKAFSATCFEAEIRYLIKHEWAQCLEDILWRRTKLGFEMSAREQKTLGDFLFSMIGSNQK